MNLVNTPITGPSRIAARLWSVALRGPLPTRLIVAGSLLLLGNPLLTLLAYRMGYQVERMPRLSLLLIGGLQGLIALYAAVVVTQLLVASAAHGVGALAGRRRGSGHGAAVLRAVGPERQGALRELARQAADVIWQHEEQGRGTIAGPVVAYIEEVIAAELRYRRRMRALADRLSRLRVPTRK